MEFPTNPDDVITEKEAAAKFKRTARWLADIRKEAARLGDQSFPGFKVGRSYFYEGSKLVAWLKQRGQAQPPSDSRPNPHAVH